MPHSFGPHYPVVRATEDYWYGICAVLMHKLAVAKVQITPRDLEKFAASNERSIVIDTRGEMITLSLVSDAEGQRLAREEGGLAV